MSLIDDKWDYNVHLSKIDDDHFGEFQNSFSNLFSAVNVLASGLSGDKFHCSNNNPQSCNNDLKTLSEQNKKLKVEIDTILADLSNKEAQYETYKQDRKLLSQEIKETHEAFLMAKKYYKKFLKIYYTIEKTTDCKQIIFVQFFTESKKESENYSVRLHRDIKTQHYELADMQPKLKSYKEIQKKFQETNDLPGALCFIRQKFLKLKKVK